MSGEPASCDTATVAPAAAETGSDVSSKEEHRSPAVHAVPVKDGLATKAPISLEAYVQTTSKLDGRDKVTKIMQYGARFLSWYFTSVAPNKALQERAHLLYRTTQVSRKAFRMLKVADEAVKIMAIAQNKQQRGTLKGKPEHCHGQPTRSAAMGLFWTMDNLHYLTTTKTVAYGHQRALKVFSRCWTVASLCMIVLSTQALRETGQRRSALAEELARLTADAQSPHTAVEKAAADLRAANAQHFKNCLALLKAVMDLTCAVNISGVDLPKKVFGKKLNDGVIGASGIVSALTVLYNCWPDQPKGASLPQQQRQITAAATTTSTANGSVPVAAATATTAT
ncbi:peroxisomal biogenesis factor 11-domain-containing protein [Tribonema minus]|uniref:Peroxisomal biogenesis factor 11-domain-containing protein n=1 Tax=Tribonema minus TaxID=303371 RepID=A0A836CN76_9STRA|nr:peroxisomal biogenesis factor 11-domain-containing protein [Tribonema minus]